MKIDIGQAANTLASLGVIGGLIFVGLQMQQDREIAASDRMLATEANTDYWAELVTNSADVWQRGLAGEELSPTEYVQFDALANARQFSFFVRWLNTNRAVADTSQTTADRFVREAARDIHLNPGLLTWWRRHYAQLQEIEASTAGDGGFDELLNKELQRLSSQNGGD